MQLEIPEYERGLTEAVNLSLLIQFAVKHGLCINPPTMSYGDYKSLLEYEITLDEVAA